MNQALTAWVFTASGRGPAGRLVYIQTGAEGRQKRKAKKWWLLQLCPPSRKGGHSCRGANVDCRKNDCAGIWPGKGEGVVAVLHTLQGLLLK